jgi:hypothetical protein
MFGAEVGCSSVGEVVYKEHTKIIFHHHSKYTLHSTLLQNTQ